MTQNTWLSAGVLNPTAAANGKKSAVGTYGDEKTEPAWLAYTSTPTHPLDGAAYVIELDVSGSDSRVRSLNNYGSPTITDPGSTRSASRASMLFYFPSGTTLTSRVRIMSNVVVSTDGFALYINPDRTMDLEYNGLAFLTNGSGGTTKTLNTNQWYQLEVWAIGKDGSGTALGYTQWVVRVAEGTGGGGAFTGGAAPTVTTVMNGRHATTDSNSGLAFADLFTLGDNVSSHAASSGAGKLYFANLYSDYENADDPYGLIRAYHIAPSADSGTDNAWLSSSGGSKYADVDEWPFSDTDYINSSATSEARQAQQIPDISGSITASDVVIALGISCRMDFSAGGKGVGSDTHPYIFDGTTRYNGRTAGNFSYASAGGVGYKQAWDRWVDGSTKLAQTHMDSAGELQFGIRGTVSSGGTVNYYAVHGIIAWQKSGETTGALTAAPALQAGKLYEVNQAKNRAAVI